MEMVRESREQFFGQLRRIDNNRCFRYDAEPDLRCAVFTGAGKKAFCAGMDLKQRLDIRNEGDVAHEYPSGGFGGMSNRTGKKPIVVACNGHAHGMISQHVQALRGIDSANKIPRWWL